MYVPEGSKYIFRKHHRRSNPYRVFAMLMVLIAGLFVLRGVASGSVKPAFMPTATPTRVVNSYVLEGDARFVAGDLNGAIDAFQQAIDLEPDNALLLAELARLQAYSSTFMTSDSEVLGALQEAKKNVDRAVELNPDSSTVNAMRAFVLDWNANPSLISMEETEKMLSDAEQAALRAIDLDPDNALALAYSAEILVDQQRWLDAEERVALALEKGPELMDVHRVSGYVQESLGNYSQAITEYETALTINPNLPFLHMKIGYNYRTIAGRINQFEREMEWQATYELALESFAKVVTINKQLGINDPVPYIAIAKTYAQMGEFFAASWNISTALSYAPENPDLYGQTGVIFFQARNYESSELALRCAVRGCDAETSCEVRECNTETDPPLVISGLPLSEGSKWYYLDYGSVLAALHRPTDPRCPDAMQVFKELRQKYGDDALVMSIVEVGEDTCRSYGY